MVQQRLRQKDNSNKAWLCLEQLYICVQATDHGVSQERILEWVAISFSKGSSWPRDWTNVSWISCTGRQILYFCAPGKPRTVVYHPQNNFLVLYSELFITMWHVTISMRFCVCVCVCVCVYFPLHNFEQYIKLGGHNLLNIALINHFTSLFIAL